MKKKSVNQLARIGVYGLLFLSLALLVSSVQESRDLRSRASDQARYGDPLPAPFLRLSVPRAQYVAGSTVPVTVSVHTGSMPSVEARIVLDYDPAVLSLTRENIVNQGSFSVTNVETLENGHLETSFFITEEAGYAPVSTVSETKVAQLNFTVRNASTGSTDILLSFDGIDPELSGVFMPPDESGGEIRNILKTASGTRIFLTR